MTCPKCGSVKPYVLCTLSADNYADVDSEDPEYEERSEMMVDTAISIWLHVCRDCKEILDGGIEDWGVLGKVQSA